MNAGVDWSAITDDMLDVELAYSTQHCFSDRCGDVFAPFIVCTRGANHVDRESREGLPVLHVTGWGADRIRWSL